MKHQKAFAVAGMLAAILGIASRNATAVPSESSHPNIVFMMADDLGWKDVGYQGSEIQTPHIDRLAEQGIRLNHYYAYPMCSPTRAALMTGRVPLRMGIDFALGAEGGLPTDELILPEVLQKAGYQTFMVGKWHLGARHVKHFPHNRGFDHFYGHLNAGIDYYSHLREGALDWQRNGKSVREEGYSTELLTAEALRLLERRDPKRPFFLYVAFNAPHAPLQAPPEFIEKYAHIPNEDRRIYAAMVDCMDHSVGRIVEALDASGARDETLIVWVSDNGGGRAADNSPLRGGKTSVFEGGLRVPGLVNWPSRIASGKVLDQQFSVHDWLPTLTTAAGIEWAPRKPLDGQNMWPALARGEQVARKDLVIGYRGRRSVFRGNWKLVQEAPAEGDVVVPMLFDILADPEEKVDLAKAQPGVLQELKAIAAQFPVIEGPAGEEGGRRGRDGRGRATQTARQLLEQFDQDGDGKVSSQELPERRRTALMQRDTDGDGLLSEAELEAGRRQGRLPGGAARGPRSDVSSEETRPPVAESAAGNPREVKKPPTSGEKN